MLGNDRMSRSAHEAHHKSERAMTLTVGAPHFVGSPCGHHGHYTFYKAFKYQLRGHGSTGNGRILMLGEFFFLRISPHDDPCIGELQLLWEDSNSDQLLSSTRLYFLPEQTPDGRQPNHGEHEVLAVSDKVILRLSDLVSWITDQVDWMTGLQTQTIMKPTIGNNNNANNNNNGKYQWQSMHPIAINSGLDFDDVIHEKQVIDDMRSSSSVVVLSYPRYCRYRALLRRIEGQEYEWLNKESVRLAINSLGIPTTAAKMNILFCRDTFEHEALLQNDLNCDHLAPKLKGRPRKKPTANSKSGCQRSSSPESNTSDESKTSQIRTTRRSALNRSNSNEKSSGGSNGSSAGSGVAKHSGHKVNNNNGNHTTTNSNARLKDICIKSEQTFLKQLNKFMRERKTPIQRVPHLGFKQIDLYFFYTHAQKLGGYDKITSNKLWKRLYDEMGGDPGSTSAATCTRRHYERLLLPFERHLNGDQDKRKRRKTTVSAKKGSKKSGSHSIKYKGKVGKQVVNGVKGKSKCDEEENYSDAEPEKKQLYDNDDDDDINDDGEPKQPKLIVKLNLLKVKKEREDGAPLADSGSASADHLVKHDQIVSAKSEDNHNSAERANDNNDNTDTEDESKKELSREDVTEEEVDDEEDDDDDEEEDEVKDVLKNSANTETVIHLSPVSDISNDDEVSACDNKIESSSASSTTSPLNQTQTRAQPLVLETKNNSSQHSSSVASLPFPVAANPLFSISSLVNSVDSSTPPPSPKTAPQCGPQTIPLALPPPQPQTPTQAPPPPPRMIPMAKPSPAIVTPRPSLLSCVKSTSFNIYPRRPSVIHRASNPIYTLPEYHSKVIANNKNISATTPLPAHCRALKSECEPKKIAFDYSCSDVLDLSVKKRCLEADSRTSPSQVTIDGSYLLDLSVKKKKSEPSESPIQLQVPKPKLEPVSPVPLSSPSHKSCPQPVVNNLPQSVQKSVHYNQRALPLFESQAKQQQLQQQSKHHHYHHHTQHKQQNEQHFKLHNHSQQHSHQSPHQLSPQQIVKPKVRHASQTYLTTQSTTKQISSNNSDKRVQHQQQQHQQNHRNHNLHQHDRQHIDKQYQHSSGHHQSQQQKQNAKTPISESSPKVSQSSPQTSQHQSSGGHNSTPTTTSSMRPSISEYNPALPAFYATPNFWWQNSPSQYPTNLTTSGAQYMTPIASVSPQLLIPSPSAYQSDHHLLSPFDSAKAANFVAYKQLMDQQQGFFFQHINNYYATK